MTADIELIAKLILTLFSKTALDTIERAAAPNEYPGKLCKNAFDSALKEVLELVKKTDE